jgi:hypothetical protein
VQLYDCARVIRSKNAGPFTLTIDLMFEDVDKFEKVLTSQAFTPGEIATLYGVDESKVAIHAFRNVLAIKVSLPRPGSSSGAPGDRDVYGSQQHFPLASIEICA